MPKNINNFHDKFFKSMMNDLDVAKEFLNSFLPSDIIDIIDIASINNAKTDFILHDLKEVFSDVVFDCKLKDDTKAYISIVLEHKSRPDKYTAIQLLLYIAYSYY